MIPKLPFSVLFFTYYLHGIFLNPQHFATEGPPGVLSQTIPFLQHLSVRICRKLYAPNGTILNTGETLINLELADTLEIIANANSSDPFYRGQIADIMEEEVNSKGGILTIEDLKAYRAVLRKPVSTKLGAYTMLNTPAPASGPVLALIMNILKGEFQNKHNHLLIIVNSNKE